MPAPSTALRNGGHVVADVLAAHGVRHVFGQDSPEWLYEALDAAVTRPVTMRDERSAGFAADAAARLTGRPAVACGIHGPGALNLMTALLEAQAACSPVVALISGVETTVAGSGAFQETDHVAIARPLVKWATRVERVDRLAGVVDRALRIATSGCPGPVLVELPNDVMGEAQPDAAPPVDRGPAASAPEVDAVAALLAQARRPVVLAGNGARMAGARSALVALAERLEAPVAVTAMGRGAFPETHRLFAGVAGFMSDREDGSGAVANPLLADADAVLVLGSALDGVTTDGGRLPGPEARIVRVDVDAERLATGPAVAHAVQADARAAAEALVRALGPGTGTPWAPLEERWAAVAAAQERLAASAAAPVHPARLYAELRSVLAPTDLVVCDAAYSSVWALSHLREGRDFGAIAYGRAAGTLGFGLPGAIGAAAAFPDRRVVALVGDGGLGFAWAELETLARERLDVTCVVLDNGCFAYQKLWHDLWEGTSRGLDFAEVRHDRLAEAAGVAGVLVREPGELGPALRSAIETPGPALVDVLTDPDALPPFNFERHRGR